MKSSRARTGLVIVLQHVRHLARTHQDDNNCVYNQASRFTTQARLRVYTRHFITPFARPLLYTKVFLPTMYIERTFVFDCRAQYKLWNYY
jgi:hypothetical protein